MSSIRPILLRTWLPVLLALALGGCGSRNSQSTFTPTSGGAHTEAGWLPAVHATSAEANISACAQCHGSDFSGGTSKVACTQCHMGDQQNVHPVSWGYMAYAKHGPYVEQSGIAMCNNIYCHGTSLKGVASSGPSCTSCHLGGPYRVHPGAGVDATTDFNNWAKNTTSSYFHGTYVANNGVNSCSNTVCHGTSLQGVTGSGSSCQACHANYTSFYSSKKK